MTGLASTARVGTKAAESLRAEYENEIGKRDLRLTALAEQLSRAETTIKEQRDRPRASDLGFLGALRRG